MAQDMGLITDTWMTNPWMFDPTQKSNQFSNYTNARLPYPPTYNGAPVSAATGKPIQSFLDWQQANPGGLSINSTPAQPQAPAAPAQGLSPYDQRMQAMGAPGSPGSYAQDPAMQARINPGPSAYYGNNGNNAFSSNQYENGRAQLTPFAQSPLAAPQQAPQQQAAPQASGPPNNWQAALNALANPGNPQTMGANVPLQTGYQPSGGVNQAFLQQAGGGQGMNQNFLSSLRALQNR